ncbi:hypothetical protein DPMN_040695 [Dreissena polymorpha]|uniref:Uncharacterized protein n=2 Tax=Dreissena polymorpha TaxID=45954 RepID=A0A9D4CY43_DREPO|nr:hypothetical protein DPMN_040695 [Dreissena polymorpha]
MTHLGYGEEIRRRRILKYRKRDRIVNAKWIYITFITAGSKAEGLTCCYESDYENVFVPKDVLCVEAGVDLHTIPNDI